MKGDQRQVLGSTEAPLTAWFSGVKLPGEELRRSLKVVPYAKRRGLTQGCIRAKCRRYEDIIPLNDMDQYRA